MPVKIIRCFFFSPLVKGIIFLVAAVRWEGRTVFLVPHSSPFSGGFALVRVEMHSLLSFLAQPVNPRLFSRQRLLPG